MGLNFKEVAALRGNDKVFEENYSQIDWSKASGDIPHNIVSDIKFVKELISIPHVTLSTALNYLKLFRGTLNEGAEYDKLDKTISEIEDKVKGQ